MEEEYREMATMAKEMRDILALQNKMSINIQQKVEPLLEALSSAKMKLAPTNIKTQLEQVNEIIKNSKTEIVPPQLLKKGHRMHI